MSQIHLVAGKIAGVQSTCISKPVHFLCHAFNDNKAPVRPSYDKTRANAMGRQLIETYYAALIFDLAQTTIAEMQRKTIGNALCDAFMDELCAYREYTAVKPSHYTKANEIIANMVAQLPAIETPALIERAFERLAMEAERIPLIGTTSDYQFKRYQAMAQNTSMAISIFRDWIKTGEGSAALASLSGCAETQSPQKAAIDFAKLFIADHIKVSVAAVKLNGYQAKQGFERRMAKNQKAISWKRRGLELVINT